MKLQRNNLFTSLPKSTISDIISRKIKAQEISQNPYKKQRRSLFTKAIRTQLRHRSKGFQDPKSRLNILIIYMQILILAYCYQILICCLVYLHISLIYSPKRTKKQRLDSSNRKHKYSNI